MGPKIKYFSHNCQRIHTKYTKYGANQETDSKLSNLQQQVHHIQECEEDLFSLQGMDSAYQRTLQRNASDHGDGKAN